MEGILEKAAVKRFQQAAQGLGINSNITILANSARTAEDAARSLEVEVGQIASSLIFRLPDGDPILIITSGRHKVNLDLVSSNLGVRSLDRADIDFVKEFSGYSVGGVAPIGWLSKPKLTIIDEVLSEYKVAWAAAGHPHAVFSTSYSELIQLTGATSMVVGD
jgi:prolyl-tRNA editing enzyme YbaK/EbsC (Cys-tRNA(Pro) deacylase)